MGQVPAIRQSSFQYTLVGDGRLGRHLAHYFKLSGIPFRGWSRKLSLEHGESLGDAVAESHVVLLAIRDSAIETFVKEHPELGGKKLIHFSGSLSTPLAEGFHPLCTFSDDLYALEIYRSISFVGERGASNFREVFPALKNPFYTISKEDKAKYHAVCAMGGGFTVLLWQKLFDSFESELGLPRSAAAPYLSQIVDNLNLNPVTALTGPIQRRDYVTVQNHLNALEGDSFQNIYRSFLQVFAPEFKEADPRTTVI